MDVPGRKRRRAKARTVTNAGVLHTEVPGKPTYAERAAPILQRALDNMGWACASRKLLKFAGAGGRGWIRNLLKIVGGVGAGCFRTPTFPSTDRDMHRARQTTTFSGLRASCEAWRYYYSITMSTGQRQHVRCNNKSAASPP